VPNEFEFLREFAASNTFSYPTAREQLRALWTAYCLHNDIDVDTRNYDNGISALWLEMTEDDGWQSIILFDVFMSRHLV